MRTRRFTITAFLLAAIMVLGIGFAALTDKLAIDGHAVIDKSSAESTFDGDIYFTNVIEKSDDSITASIDSDDTTKDTVKFHIANFKEVNQEEHVVFQIASIFNAQANLVVAITNAREDYFDVTTDWGATNSTTIAACSNPEEPIYKTIKVTVRLKSIPTTTIDSAISLMITATVPD